VSVDEWLKSTVLFQEFTPDELQQVAAICVDVNYPKGERLFKEGDKSTTILLIKEGTIRVTKGPEKTELITTGAGESLGELSFLDEGRRSATAKTLEATQLISIPNDGLKSILDANPAMAIKFYHSAGRYICRRLRQTNDILEVVKKAIDKVLLAI